MRYVTYAKDGYIWVVDQIEAHPHVGFWVAVGLVVSARLV